MASPAATPSSPAGTPQASSSIVQAIRLSPFQAKCLLEGIGTFILVLTMSLAEANSGIAAINGTTRTRNLAPIAVGFMFSVIVFSFGYISGGHVNPAITLGVMLVRLIRLELAVAYIISQTIGAIAGAIFGLIIQGSTGTLPAPQVYRNLPEYVVRGFIGEAIFTGALVTIVLHVAYSKQRNNHYYGLAIGMCVLSATYAVGGVSGGCFNPAAATGLQLVKCFSGYCLPLMHLWLYWAAPAAGAVGASLLFKMTHPPPDQARGQQVQQALQTEY